MFPRVQRLSAFTLLELMIAMALSAVLMSTAYLALHLVQRQQHMASRTLSAVAQVSALQGLLTQDFRRARSVRVDGERVYCQQADRLIEYVLLDSCILRHQAAVQDTFFVSVLDYQYLSKAQPLTTRHGLVDEVTLTIQSLRDTLVLQAAVRYDAQSLLQPFSASFSSR